jgi:TetR/AcrR family transcriptional regulator
MYARLMVELPAHLRGAPMGAATLSREELAVHQADRVLNAATPVFARRGYQATSVDDILSAGKVGVGNFYTLFEGKEDCFLACLDRIVGEARRRISTATEGERDWDCRAYLGLGAVIGYLCAEPLDARILLVEAQSAGAEATSRYNALLDEAVAWLASGRRGYSEAKALPASFERAAVPGLAFYLQRCLLEIERPAPEGLLAETAGLLFEPIVGRERIERLNRELSRAAVAA